jgi:hypothetical protein|tara:strand:+ start:1108 stop:2538 length:1431 start_codon:yes stop_codon:yes gene_type:complete
MSIPNGGLITETNRQYYAGAQQFYISTAGGGQTFTSTFDADLIWGSSDPLNNDFLLNNFDIFTSPDAQTWTALTPNSSIATTTMVAPIVGGGGVTQPGANVTLNIVIANINVVPGMLIKNTAGTTTYGRVTSVTTSNIFICNITTGIPSGIDLTLNSPSPWSSTNNVVTVVNNLTVGTYVKIQLRPAAIEESYGNYEYTRLDDVIENFLVAYVGPDKLIPSVKRTDVIFHAKRGLQEFSYDTLKSIRSQELTVNDALSVIIPQDYVNYVRLSFIDGAGVQRTIFPANTLTTNPYANPVQDNDGVPTQDSQDENVDGTSQTEAAWAANDPRSISGAFVNDYDNISVLYNSLYDTALGQRYGLNPETSQKNGWFTINEREGRFAFSNDLKGALIVLEYISDGNAYDLDLKIPKLAEDALYSYIMYGILSSTAKISEYIIRRIGKEKSAKLRNAKIRLSNLKSQEMLQVMRGQSKWIKY